MKRFRNIIFDFDGTLVDTSPLIVATMQTTAKELGLDARTDAECRSTIGIRLEDVPPVLWPDNADATENFASTYRIVFDRLKRPLDVKCFPGVLDMLRSLHESGCRMAIASSRSHKSLQEYVDQFRLSVYFSILVGGNDVEHGKPSPEPVIRILESCGWDASETLTVGDAPVDIMMGRAAGTATCAVTYGNGTIEELVSAQPTYFIPEFTAELRKQP